MAGRAGSAYMVNPMSRWRSRFSAIISSVQSKEAPDRPCYGVSHVLRPTFRGFCTVFGFSLFGRVGVYSGISQWYRVGDAGALRAGRALSHPLSCAVKNSEKKHSQDSKCSRERQAAAPSQDEAEESDATEEEATRETTTRRGRPRGGTKVEARIGEGLRREIGRGGRPGVGDG